MADIIPCQACGLQGAHSVASQFIFKDQPYTLKRCISCSSLFYDPLPVIDYTTHTEDPVFIRDYVEANANIHNLVMLGLGVTGGRRNGRLLDMGCGYGFAADAVRRLRDWEVIGVEPSTYGRVGEKALGIRILSEFVDAGHWLTRERFDAIISSEVVEHIDQPTNFLAMLRGMLTDTGVLAITVPEAESALTVENEGSRNALLSPGAHITLFSQRGLEIALRNAGFAHIKVEKKLYSLNAIASNAPLMPVPMGDMMDEYIAYLRLLIETANGNDSLRHGAASRLFRALVNLNRLKEAAAVEDDMPPAVVDLKHRASSYSEFISRVGPSVPVDLYYYGILELNDRANPDFAAELFAASYDLCIKKIDVLPGGAVVEIELIWVILFHQAYAKMIAGKPAEARRILARFDDPIPNGLSAPRGDILSRVVDLKERLDIMDGTIALPPIAYKFMVDRVAKLFNYIHISGWFHHPTDHLSEVILHDPQNKSIKIQTGLAHNGIEDTLGPNRGFRIDVLRESDELDHDVDIEFKTSDGWTHRQSLISLAKIRRGKNLTNEIADQFRELLRAIPSAMILDLGGRNYSRDERTHTWPGATYQVIDRQAGEFVDVVADPHDMSQHIAPASVDAIISTSTFEHLEKPWKVVGEMNRVLKTGGLAYITTHQTIALHDTPNDLWRYSQDTWGSIFNNETGFEIVGRAMDDEQFIVPFLYHEGRHNVEEECGFESTVVLVRKVGEL